MTALTDRIAYSAFVIAVALGVSGYFVHIPYVQALVAEFTATAMGLGLGVLLINKFLNSSEKKRAAAPLLRLIGPNVSKLHNELFIRAGHRRFGIPVFNKIIDDYSNNKRRPETFSPEQRSELFNHIQSMRNELMPTFDTLQDQFRELSAIAGWSFDPRLVAAALDARLTFATFKSLPWDDSVATENTQLRAVEAYLDADAYTSRVFSLLNEHVGTPQTEWLGES